MSTPKNYNQEHDFEIADPNNVEEMSDAAGNRSSSVQEQSPAKSGTNSWLSRLAQMHSADVQQQPAEKALETENTQEEQVCLYMEQFATQVPTIEHSPIKFWKSKEKDFPKLAKLAFDLLAIPATSAAVECVFSQAGIATCGRKSNAGPKLLEMECLIKYNQNYLLS